MTSKSKRLIVRESKYHSKGVFASEDISVGNVIEEIRGKMFERPTRYTVQLGEDRHMDVEGEVVPFLNHSCDPNARLVIDGRGPRFEAVRNIKRGEEITFNYLTTELDMDSPFVCNCGKPGCNGEISGFKHIPPEKQQMLLPFCSEYLVEYFSINSLKDLARVTPHGRNKKEHSAGE